MKNLTFSVSDRCNIRCRFCAPVCGPEHKTYLSSDDMILIYNRLSRYTPIPLVVFTGGEPMLFQKEVFETLKHIQKSTNKPICRIVSNGFWGKDKDKALDLINTLLELGLDELNLSVDDFHQEFIPFDNIKNIVDAAYGKGMTILLAHKTYPNSKHNKKVYENLLERKLTVFREGSDRTDIDKSDILISIGYTIPRGRGTGSVDLDSWIPKKYIENKIHEGPCKSVFESINITAEGGLSACCGLIRRGIPLFNIEDMVNGDYNEIFRRMNQSIIFNWLALCGPAEIMHTLLAMDESLSFKGKYVQKCEICEELFFDDVKVNMISNILPDVADMLSFKRGIYEAKKLIYFENGQHA